MYYTGGDIMSLIQRMKITGAYRVPVFDEVLDEVSKTEGDKIIADSAIEVVVGENTYNGSTIARSLMVDLLVQDLTVPSTNDDGRLHWVDASEDVVCQGMTVPIVDVKEAHRLATEQAQLIFG